MKIVQLEKEGVICLKIDGRLDAESATEAETTVKGILKEGTQRLLFDLSRMDLHQQRRPAGDPDGGQGTAEQEGQGSSLRPQPPMSKKSSM